MKRRKKHFWIMFTHRFFFCRTCVCGWYGALCSQTVICASVLEPMQWFPWRNPDFFNAVVPEGLDLIYNQDLSSLCTGGKNISIERDDESHFSMGVSTGKINLWAVLNALYIMSSMIKSWHAQAWWITYRRENKKMALLGENARLLEYSRKVVLLSLWLLDSLQARSQ